MSRMNGLVAQKRVSLARALEPALGFEVSAPADASTSGPCEERASVLELANGPQFVEHAQRSLGLGPSLIVRSRRPLCLGKPETRHRLVPPRVERGEALSRAGEGV